jgi:hypothetical protein
MEICFVVLDLVLWNVNSSFIRCAGGFLWLAVVLQFVDTGVATFLLALVVSVLSWC